MTVWWLEQKSNHHQMMILFAMMLILQKCKIRPTYPNVVFETFIFVNLIFGFGGCKTINNSPENRPSQTKNGSYSNHPTIHFQVQTCCIRFRGGEVFCINKSLCLLGLCLGLPLGICLGLEWVLHHQNPASVWAPQSTPVPRTPGCQGPKWPYASDVLGGSSHLVST